MKRTLLRSVTLYTRNLLHSPSIQNNPIPSPSSLAASTRPRLRLRFYSSENDSSSSSSSENPSSAPDPETSLAQPQKKDVSIDVEDVSNKGKQHGYILLCLVAQKVGATKSINFKLLVDFFYCLLFHFRGLSMVSSKNDIVKYVKKGKLFIFSVSEIMRFKFIFIHLKFSQETNKAFRFLHLIVLYFN